MARELKLLAESHMDIGNVRQIVLNELSKQDHRLMILDNVDDVDLITNFMPLRRGIGHVLITIRNREAHIHSKIKGDSIQLDDMTKNEAALVFLKEFLGEDQETQRETKYLIWLKDFSFSPLQLFKRLRI